MLTYFKFLALQTGMTNEELGVVLNRPLSAIKDYNRGKGNPPEDAVEKLLEIIDYIDQYAQEHAMKILDMMEKNPKVSIGLPIPVSPTDKIARQVGFPTRSAENMAIGKLISHFPEDMIVDLQFVERPPLINN